MRLIARTCVLKPIVPYPFFFFMMTLFVTMFVFVLVVTLVLLVPGVFRVSVVPVALTLV